MRRAVVVAAALACVGCGGLQGAGAFGPAPAAAPSRGWGVVSSRSGGGLSMGRGNSFRPGGGESKRQARVAQLITAELSDIIRLGRKIKAKPLDDSVRCKISIVDVSLSPDLRHAKVYISVFGDRLERREAVTWCVENCRALRHTLSQRLKDMRGIPELQFRETDVGAAVGIMHLVDQAAGKKEGGVTASGLQEMGVIDFDDDEWEWDFEEVPASQ
jgi:ribosome-binding factor A